MGRGMMNEYGPGVFNDIYEFLGIWANAAGGCIFILVAERGGFELWVIYTIWVQAVIFRQWE